METNGLPVPHPILRATLTSHLAVVRLRYFRLALKKHMQFLRKLKKLGELPPELEHFCHASRPSEPSTEARGFLPPLKSPEPRSTQTKTHHNPPVHLPPVNSQHTPSRRGNRRVDKNKVGDLHSTIKDQQRQLELYHEKTTLLEKINQYSAFALPSSSSAHLL